jgi:3-phosphoshikimate 1-carboxyvinyltransferase
MGDITLLPFDKPFTATANVPGSKSLSNRALVMAALADGVCELSNVLFADDTRVMLDGLKQLGFKLELDESSHTVKVEGRGGKIAASDATLFCGNSGTTIRFLAAMCALGNGSFTLDGVSRMRQRPIRELVEPLRNLGSRVEFLGEQGYPPLKIIADGLPGGILKYGSAASSQFLSAVLMVSPYARHEVQIDLEGQQTSWPYVAMTMQLMDRFGVTPELLRDPNTGEPKQIVIPEGKYAGTKYQIEPDASNAAYFLSAAAIHPGAKVTVNGLGKSSLQGDVGLADILRRMGANLVFGKDFITVMGTETLEGIDVNLLAMPDQAQTLAVVALFAHGETTLRGLHTLRVKETDRLTALSNELQKFGAKVVIEGDDVLVIDPPERVRPATVETYDDHRMAMSFALAGTKLEHVTIQGAECVNKTYPEFFRDLEKLRGSVA